MQNPVRTIDLPFGITCIDTMLHRPNLVSCYLLIQDGVAGFVDTGVGNSVPILLEVLRRKGLDRRDVAYVMPTHVHLDHAGGAGRLMQELPDAKLIVHPRAARHMIDPTRLQQGSMAVYGEQRYRQLFGELVPVPADRVIEVDDDFTLDFNGRTLRFLDTPGHARHHYCIYDAASEGLFTGDTFGASYGELNQGRRPFIFPPSTPVQFDPQAWQATLERLLALQPQRVFVTHFGMHENVPLLGRLLAQAIDEYAAMAQDMGANGKADEDILARRLMDYSVNTLLDNSCGLATEEIESLLAMDMALNAQGLCHWLNTKSQVEARAR